MNSIKIELPFLLLTSDYHEGYWFEDSLRKITNSEFKSRELDMIDNKYCFLFYAENPSEEEIQNLIQLEY